MYLTRLLHDNFDASIYSFNTIILSLILTSERLSVPHGKALLLNVVHVVIPAQEQDPFLGVCRPFFCLIDKKRFNKCSYLYRAVCKMNTRVPTRS